VYEALGALVDKRVEIKSDNHAIVWSSSRNKFYHVRCSSDGHALMVNDNGSYYQGYLGYPAIAVLMHQGRLPYQEAFGELCRNIPWKDINQAHQNDFDKVIASITAGWLPAQRTVVDRFCSEVISELESLQLRHLGEKEIPPEGY
jgi:hypothetical protein